MDKYTNNDTDAQLSQYIASEHKKILGLFERSCLIEQADNKKKETRANIVANNATSNIHSVNLGF